MESFAVDLDKVLDDFELSEDAEPDVVDGRLKDSDLTNVTQTDVVNPHSEFPAVSTKVSDVQINHISLLSEVTSQQNSILTDASSVLLKHEVSNCDAPVNGTNGIGSHTLSNGLAVNCLEDQDIQGQNQYTELSKEKDSKENTYQNKEFDFDNKLAECIDGISGEENLKVTANITKETDTGALNLQAINQQKLNASMCQQSLYSTSPTQNNDIEFVDFERESTSQPSTLSSLTSTASSMSPKHEKSSFDINYQKNENIVSYQNECTHPVGFSNCDMPCEDDLKDLDAYQLSVEGADAEVATKNVLGLNVTQDDIEIVTDSLQENVDSVNGFSGEIDSNEKEGLQTVSHSDHVEEFLARLVMSPGITTPMEDAGYSKVPGYVPTTIDTVIENSEEKDDGDNVSGNVAPTIFQLVKKQTDTMVDSEVLKEQNFSEHVVSCHQQISEDKISVPFSVENQAIHNCNLSKSPTGIGARPKDVSIKKNRPNSLHGLSKPELPQHRTKCNLSITNSICTENEEVDSRIITGDMPSTSNPMGSGMNLKVNSCDQISDQVCTQNSSGFFQNIVGGVEQKEVAGSGVDILSPEQHMESVDAGHTPHCHNPPYSLSLFVPSNISEVNIDTNVQENVINLASQEDSVASEINHQKRKRPTTLSLSPRINFDQGSGNQTTNAIIPDSDSSVSSTPVYTLEAGPGAMTMTPTISSNMNVAITQLGHVSPRWIPDAEAPTCMQCDLRFTFTKRRHHCRACGKVFCSTCCNLKCKLQYMEMKEARVCSKCYQDLVRAQVYQRREPTVESSPNPNNPSEYCSTIPPLQQAQSSVNTPPPVVMVPVGVLRKEGSQRVKEPKQVMFSDGIRPGGDLTELETSIEPRIPILKKNSRLSKKLEKIGSGASSSSSKAKRIADLARNVCLVPEEGLPPILKSGTGACDTLEECPDEEQVIQRMKDKENLQPVTFIISKNLHVKVSLVNLDCCVQRICWCFSTLGMCTVSQDEIIIVLECLHEEAVLPKDLFHYLYGLYDDANKGNTISDLSHTIVGEAYNEKGFLGSKEHSGFLYIRPSFQCLQKLHLPPSPYLFAILLQKWETPWAKVFPVRLMLRLGAEFRYYPCPLVSERNRKPVFAEIGHTIMNLLADFRNYQYMLPQIPGVQIHMQDRKTFIRFPKNRYDKVMKVVTNSNEHVMAFGANFSLEADSHLVCIQNEEGNYQTQAINIQNKPRKVTGASFVVFNGALKSTSGLRAKSSIVEDGLMVQIMPDSMAALKNALHQMQDYVISCGTVDAPHEEIVQVQWVDQDRNRNVGILSPIDQQPLDGIESIHVHNATDFLGEQRRIRWTEVYFLENVDSGAVHTEPVDLSRLAETLAGACCVALTPHLDRLREASLSRIGLRCILDTEQVGYEVGANGAKLPDFYMNDLDNELIPVLHSAATNNHGGCVRMELIFHVIE